MPREKKEPVTPQPTFGLYFKLIFLLVLVLFGAIILNTTIASQNLATTKMNSKSLDSIKEFTSPEKWRDAIENEFRTNAGYKQAVKGINDTTEQVLGEATGIKDEVVDEVKNEAADFVYDQTVVAMIHSLLARMPKRQQENFKLEFCAQ
jgi:cytoskeletal protein RodZ